jgi:hypothetical protein
MISEITKNAQKFYGSMEAVSNQRYKSWEHCHNFFKSIKDKELSHTEWELAQLHLAFYLASWGMYRGSSFILQKDYTIFKPIIKDILSKKYYALWDIEKNINNKKQLNLLFVELYNLIENHLRKIRGSVKDHLDLEGLEKRYLNEREEISPTLTTKILLGTIGCIPAYDRYFIAGIGTKNIQKKFNPEKSFMSMLDFYLANKEELDSLSDKFQGYPLMKILDMYFWVLGYEYLSKRKDVGEE